MASGTGGVIGAPVTPLTAANLVDLDTLERICDFLVAHGVDGVALPMHTGESLNLTMAERKSLVETAVSAVGGRVPVFAHVSLPGTDQVIELLASGAVRTGPLTTHLYPLREVTAAFGALERREAIRPIITMGQDD